MPPNLDDGESLFKFVVQEGNGVKGLVDSGLQNVPAQYVQPPNERFDKSNAYPHDQAPIDLSGLDGLSHGQVVEAIAGAAETFGFFQVVNHGVPLQLMESLKDLADGFFGQAPEKKAIYLKGVSPSPLVQYGTGFAPERDEVMDWRDYVSMVYTNDEDALKHWPNECKEEILEYLKTSTKMVKKIVQVLFEHLGVTLDEPRMDVLTAHKMVNMNFYPTCPNPDLAVGSGRHSDMGLLTVLLQDSVGGLYVKLEQEEPGNEGEWMEIPPVPGALVINVGNILQILSNGKYKSPEHGVRTTSTQSRVSIPVFTHPLSTEKIGPLPELVERDGVAHYRELIVVDYVNYFYEKNHKGKASLDFAKI